MSYNKESLLRRIEQGENLEYIGFWEHYGNTKKAHKGCLSQWYSSKFIIDGVCYNCVEQYMMAEKARLFKDTEILNQILETSKQPEIKFLGRQVRNFDETIWKEHRYNIVVRGNIEKFNQNIKLKEYLISTGQKVLVEASPYDTIWGIGMFEDNPNVKNPSRWGGLNLLGFALMEVRDKIKIQ